MEDYNGYETVKERLILSGISELQKHSIEDLSLRKVATLCNVSCAAPYKHFKNKQEFISEIIMYINHQWTKLRGQVMEAFSDNEKAQVVEVCIAYIKFCMANPSFRNILVMKTDDLNDKTIHRDFYFSEDENLIRRYCFFHFKDKRLAERKTFIIHSIVYGTTYMLDKSHFENSRETIEKIREVLEEELE